MKLLCLFFSIILAQASSGPVEIKINPIFNPYLNKFVTEANKHSLAKSIVNYHLSELSIQFGDVKLLDPEADAHCALDHKQIIIDKTVWNLLDNSLRQEMIDHELGHCLLGRAHRHLKDGEVVVSIMYPKIMSQDHYRADYYEELFEAKYFDSEYRSETRVFTTFLLNPELGKMDRTQTWKELLTIMDDYSNFDKDTTITLSRVAQLIESAKLNYKF